MEGQQAWLALDVVDESEEANLLLRQLAAALIDDDCVGVYSAVDNVLFAGTADLRQRMADPAVQSTELNKLGEDQWLYHYEESDDTLTMYQLSEAFRRKQPDGELVVEVALNNGEVIELVKCRILAVQSERHHRFTAEVLVPAKSDLRLTAGQRLTIEPSDVSSSRIVKADNLERLGETLEN